MSTAVVIVSHNHAEYIEEAILSVKRQDSQPSELICVDDASTSGQADQTRKTCELYGVPYFATAYGHPTPARRFGLAETNSPFLCFLDGDDFLSLNYLDGEKMFTQDYRIGIVYSDVRTFGEREERRNAPAIIELGEQCWGHNWIHAGSLARRDALTVSDAFRDHGSMDVWEDFYAWRHVLQTGFSAVKNPDSLYHYRKHPTNRHKEYCTRADWYDQGGLFDARVEVFTPLSGREWAIGDYFQWLNKLEWSPKRLSVWLHDTSGDDWFHGIIRTGVYQLPWDVRITRGDPIRPKLADLPRGENSDDVRMACARIYNRLARESVGDFVLIVEDDILPRTDVIESFLRSFGPKTASVAGPYRSRYHGSYVAWQTKLGDWKPNLIESRGNGVQRVTGNGFGCTMLRGDVLRNQVMTFRDPLPDYDMSFYHRLGVQGWERLVDWSQEPQHRFWDGHKIKAVA